MKMLHSGICRGKSLTNKLIPKGIRGSNKLPFISFDECSESQLTEQDLKTLNNFTEKMKACFVSSEQFADSMKKAFDTFQNMRVEKVSNAEMQLKQAFAKPNIKAEQLQPEYDENYLPVTK